MTDETFNIRFSEDGAAQVVQKMRDIVSSAGDASAQMEALQTQLGRVRNAANPAQRAYEQLAGSLDVLGRAQKANLITGEQEVQMRTNLISQAQRQIAPVTTLINSIKAEADAWKLNASSRQSAMRTMSQTQALQRAGIILTGQEAEALAAANVAYVEARDTAVAAEAAKREAIQATARTQREAASNAAAVTRRSNIVGSIVPKIEAETAAWSENTIVRQANLRTIQQQEAVRTAGIELSAAEVEAIEKANLAYAQQRAAVDLLAKTERDLAAVRNIGGNRIQNARTQYAGAQATVQRAGAIGLLNPAQQAAMERQLAEAFAEQIDPLNRSNRLLAERAEYQRGLFLSGGTLAQVERDVTRAQEQGIAVSTGEVAQLRARAREIDRVERAYRSLQGARSLFTSVIAGIGLTLGAGEVAHGLDETTNVRNLIGISSSTPQNRTDAENQVYQIALKTHSVLEDTAKLYSRLELGAKNFGIGQKQVLALTQEINQQIRLSGTSQGESSRAVIDFAHAMTAGSVQFRELRAITTQAPYVALSIAEGLTKLAAEGTKQGEAFRKRATAAGVDPDKIGIGQLKELTSKHAIYSPDIASAEELQADETQKAFQKLTPTIAQSLTDLNTDWLRFLNNLNKGTGIAHGIGESIEFIGNHIEALVSIITIATAAFAGLWIKEKVEDFSAAIGVLGKNLLGIKPATTAIAANTSELGVNSGVLAANRGELDSVTVALARNTLARRENAAAINSPVGRARDASGRFARAGTTAAAAEGATAAVGVETAAVEGAAVGVAAEGAGVFAGIASGAGVVIGTLAAAIPLVLALGAAWLLLKDSVSVAQDQIIAFDGNQKSAIQGNVSLGDVVSGVFDFIGSASDKAAGVQQKNAKNTADVSKKASEDQLEAAQKNFQKTGDFYDQIHSKILKGLIDIITHFIVGATYISNSLDVMANSLLDMVNSVVDKVANSLIDFYNNTVVKVANYAKTVGVGAGASNLGRVNLTTNYAEQSREKRDQTTITLLQHLPNAIAGSILTAAGRRQTVRPSSLSDSEGTGDEGILDKKKAKKDPVASAFDELVKHTIPAIGAIEQLNKSLDTLAKADAKGYVAKLAAQINSYDAANKVNVAQTATGQITDAQLVARIKAAAQREAAEAIDPTGTFEKGEAEKRAQLTAGTTGNPYDRSIANAIVQAEKQIADKLKITVDQLSASDKTRIANAVKATSAQEQSTKVSDALYAQNEQRKIQIEQLHQTPELIQAENEAYAIYKDQLLAGVAGAKEAYDAQVKLNLAFVQQTEAGNAAKAMYESIIAPAKNYAQQVQALNDDLNAGLISLQKYNQVLRDETSKALSANTDALSGLQRGILDVKKEADDTASDIESTFKDTYNNLQSGFSSLFTGGSLKDALYKTFQGLTNDLSKALFHKLTDPLISSLGAKLGIPGFGDKAISAKDATIQANTVYVNGQVQGSLQGATPGVTGPAANDNSLIGAANSNIPNSSTSVNGLFGAASSNGSVGIPGFGNSSINLGNFLPSNATNNLLSGGYAGGLYSGTGFPTPTNSLSSILGTAGTQGSSNFMSLLQGGAGGSGSLAPLSSLLGGPANISAGGFGLSSLAGGLGPAGGGGLMSLFGGGAAAGGGGFLSTLMQLAPLFGFATGGGFQVAGSGGTDSQVVAFKATPGENVEVKTPAQQKDAANGNSPDVHLEQKITNVFDSGAMIDALNTNQGTKALLNFVQSNPAAIKRALA